MNQTQSSIRTTRNENLRKVIQDKFGSSQPAFAQATGISMSQVGQWVTPEGSANARNMSEGSARKIESKCLLPSGWMDQSHPNISNDVSVSLEVDDRPLSVLAAQLAKAQAKEEQRIKDLKNTEKTVSEQDLAAAFLNTDFGTAGHRELLAASVLKKACGYYCGNTIEAIMVSLGLTTRAGSVTRKGKKFLAEAFNHIMARGG